MGCMRVVFPVLLFCSLTQGAVCPTGQPKNEAALLKVERAWLRAAEHRDIAALGCILADEADAAGSLIDRDSMLASADRPGDGHYALGTCMRICTVTSLMSAGKG
jgi:hypothetical protein